MLAIRLNTCIFSGDAAPFPAASLRRALVGTSLLALCASPALSDGCVASGDTLTCTGSPSLPIIANNVGFVAIQSLTGNLVPPSGTEVAVATVTSGMNAGAGDLSVTFDDAAAGWTTTDASGLVATSSGGTGSNSGFGPDQASGGPGGEGGFVSVDVTASAVSVSGANAAAVSLSTTGGQGGSANMQPQHPDNDNITGGAAGAGGGFGNQSPAASIQVTAATMTLSGNAAGIVASVIGGAGGTLDPNNQTLGQNNVTGSAGGAGGGGGQLAAWLQLGAVALDQAGTALASLTSQGGNGSDGGAAVSQLTFGQEKATGGAGGAGGAGASVGLLGAVTVSGSAASGFTAVLAQSVGGTGGTGGMVSGGTGSSGGSGGMGGGGGAVTVGSNEAGGSFALTASLTGDGARGLLARSYGGAGGDGGATQNSYGTNGQGGAAAGGGDASEVTAWVAATVSTSGTSSDAIAFQSVGGFAGSGSAESYGAGAQSRGDGGGIGAEVTLAAGANGFGVATNGTSSDAVTAQSVGGGGGKAFQNLGLSGLGGSELAGGSGGAIELTVSGAAIATQGSFSRAIFASSVGGGGGSGGPNTSISTIGATGGTGGDGQAVTVYGLSGITTTGDQSDGILASSIGGGGGSASSAVGAFSVGGQAGGGGGDGGAVSLTYAGSISTSGADADAIHALSVGGGGGDGANVVAAGGIYENAIGGSGGKAGSGSTVSVVQQTGATGAIRTTGDRSRGILAQSIGGGGGSGGTAATGGALAGYSHSVGGSGSAGGSSGTVSVALAQGITTAGTHSDGILAQSIGGSGGNAGGVVNTALPGGISISNTVGGSGANGGNAGGVSVTAGGDIATAGTHSAAIAALATGGGGGHSGIMVSASAVDLIAVNVGVGGTGGAGGDVQGDVTVASGGALTTKGDHSSGILAHSTGGGGGHGSNVVNTSAATLATLAVEIGGAGGAAGNASAVNVTSAGPISTEGVMSTGISAISTGGGGGSGGSILNANLANVGVLGVTIGASGGGGGSAGAVTVSSGGNVSTVGHQSDAIYAASMGGKGGSAGIHLSNNASVNAATVGSVTIALGGQGGGGGTAGNVSVTTDNSIATQGDLSAGLVAQSIGGDGGRALGTVAANIGDIGNATVLIGGAGGNGGVAGTVDVVAKGTGAAITTAGVLAHGILAQSMGGSGGAGGYAGEASINIGDEASGGVSGQLGITIGGGGAPGGRSDQVTVQNAAAITTANLMSFGILAQSVGGNGGDGGNVYAFNVDVNSPDAVNFNVDVGADGGFGAEGSEVKLTNTGAITTESFMSVGAFAQSVGGNGGNGGSSYTALAQIVALSKLELDANIGGAGGGGGSGAAVTLANQATVLTKAGGSDALYAQSIGGGGGRGGNAGYLALNLGSPFATNNPESQTTVGIKVGGGGDGGSGGDSGAVTVTNTGSVTTAGTRSRAIFAQSVGGGGGDGGTSSATSFAVSDICNNNSVNTYVCNSKLDPTKEQAANLNINMTLEIGGSGSTGGNGSTVTVNNGGNLSTSGQLSHGIYAQSIGGGGGNGGEGALGIEAWTTNTLANTIADLPGNLLPSFTSIDIAVGGTGAGGGDGGAVSVTNSGAISIAGPDPSYVSKYTGFSGGTRGALSFLAGGSGIFAQSVGGGGGDGGAGSSSFTAIVTVGNSGGGGGQGGEVTVNSSGTITNTSGFSGTGIFAQSVGGGGGTAGDVGQAFSDPHEDLNIGAGIAVSASPGQGGDGGTVNVGSGGTILTTGTASPGIIAQSVGGSGGIAAVASDARTTIYVGSGVAAGNGGNVTVTNTAPIEVQGSGSVGIVGLSAGGANSSDQSGTVTINTNADITASGAGGRAILVSSDSYNNQATGDVVVNVNQGVTVQTGAGSAETILVLNGGSNSNLTNAGTIISGNAASEAVYVKTANTFSIFNYGTISGSISGETSSEGGSVGQIGLNNYGGALMNTGSLINLPGPNAIFSSQGTISPGAQGSIASTTIASGLLIEFQPGSIYLADVDPSSQVAPGIVAADMLTLTPGTFATGVGGNLIEGAIITPNMILSQPGNALQSGSANILASTFTYDASDFTVSNTATVDYQLSTSTTVSAGSTTLVLGYAISTTPWDRPGAPQVILSRVNDNHRSFGRYLETLFFQPLAGVDDPFIASLAEDVLAIPDLGSLLDSYDSYIADEALAVPDATYLASLAFSQELHDCGANDAAGRLRSGGQPECSWGRIYGRGLDYDPEAAGPTYREDVLGLALGIQGEINGDMILGGALDYESGDLTLGDGSGTVSRFMAGAVLKSELGAVTLAGSLEGGTYSSTIDRIVNVGANSFTASSEPDGSWVAAHLRANRRFDNGTSFLDPTLDIGLTSLHQSGFVETGAEGFSVAVSSLEQTTLSINPFLSFGSRFQQDGMDGQVSLRAGVLGLVGQDPSVEAAFVGVGTAGPTFLIQNDQTDLFADLGAAIDLSLSNQLVIRAEANALWSGDQASYAAQLQINYSF